MKLAVNFSREAEDLLRQGRIKVDLWKTAGFMPEVSRAAQGSLPFYYHFPLHIGQGSPYGRWSQEDLKVELKRSSVPWLNLHVWPSLSRFQTVLEKSGEAAARAWMEDDIVRELALISESIPATSIIIENLYDDYPTGLARIGMEPEFITKLVRRANVGLFLDLGHATIAASQLGQDVRSYVSRMPLDALVELHLSGTQFTDPQHAGDHFSLADHDWDLIEWFAKEIADERCTVPKMIALEHGGVGQCMFTERMDSSKLEGELERIREIFDFNV